MLNNLTFNHNCNVNSAERELSTLFVLVVTYIAYVRSHDTFHQQFFLCELTKILNFSHSFLHFFYATSKNDGTKSWNLIDVMLFYMRIRFMRPKSGTNFRIKKGSGVYYCFIWLSYHDNTLIYIHPILFLCESWYQTLVA